MAAWDGWGTNVVATRVAAVVAKKERRVDIVDVAEESCEMAQRQVGLMAGDKDLLVGEAVNAVVTAKFEKERPVAAAEIRMADFMVRFRVRNSSSIVEEGRGSLALFL